MELPLRGYSEMTPTAIFDPGTVDVLSLLPDVYYLTQLIWICC